MASGSQEEYGFCMGSGEGGDVTDSGLGFPKIAESIEYSRFAASEPKVKPGSNEVVKRTSFCEKGSDGVIAVIDGS